VHAVRPPAAGLAQHAQQRLQRRHCRLQAAHASQLSRTALYVKMMKDG
jgi:hypothetical protein